MHALQTAHVQPSISFGVPFMSSQDIYIAGSKTPDDWLAFKQELLGQGNDSLWEQAYCEYFLVRLNLKYLNPVRVLQENGSWTGEGFSIMAILCTLVEFLESIVQGLSYKYTRDSKTLGPFEYSNSQQLFESFLCKRIPFKQHFDRDIAIEFYKNVRCGLLHEAQTKDGWRTWAESYQGKLVDRPLKIVYRNNFQKAFEHFVSDYGKQLINNRELQAAFIRKFDSLCA
jgi:hypothetical protein